MERRYQSEAGPSVLASAGWALRGGFVSGFLLQRSRDESESWVKAVYRAENWGLRGRAYCWGAAPVMG